MTDTRDALNRYLDDLAAGLAPDSRSLEPGLAESIQRLADLNAAASPKLQFTEQLEERLMHASTVSPPARRLPRALVVTRLTALGGVLPRVPTDVLAKCWLPALVSAALLLLTLGVAVTAFHPTWDNWRRSDEPAAMIFATPIAEAPEPPTVFGGEPARTGTMPGPGVSADPVVIWRHMLGGESTIASAAVGEGLIVVTNSSSLVALDQATGDERWQVAIVASYSTPIIYSGKVYIGTVGDGLKAFDVANGAEVWTFRTGAIATNPEIPADDIESSPVIVDGTLFIGGGYYGGLFALDPETGVEKWRFDTHGETWASPAVADGVVYIPTQGLRDAYPDDPTPSALYAVDAKTGEQIWSFPLGPSDSSYSTPAVSDGLVVFGATHEDTETGTYLAIDTATGVERWRVETERPLWGRSPGTNGTYWLLTEETDTAGNLISAVHLATGETAWTVEVEQERINAVTNTGDVLYMSDNARDLIALDAATGTELWRLEVGRGGSPVVVDGRIYLTGGVYVYAIGSASALPASPPASPTMSESPAVERATPA